MITVELKDDKTQAALNRLAAALTDLSPVMNEIGMFLVASTEARFGETEAPDGTKWAPRAASTLAAYARQKASFGPVLHKSGQLRQGIFHSYGPDQVTVGSGEPYAAVMQFGAAAGAFGAFVGKDKRGRDHFNSIPWGDIPARPFLGLSATDRTAIEETVEEWLEGIAATGP